MKAIASRMPQGDTVPAAAILISETYRLPDATARASIAVISYFHFMNFYRSGLLDAVYQFSVNFKGGPAMTVRDFQKWRQKTILGVRS